MLGKRVVGAFVGLALLLQCSLNTLLKAETEAPQGRPRSTGIKTGTFQAEVRKTYTTNDGLPDNRILSVAVAENGTVFAGTSNGLAKFDRDRWRTVKEVFGPVKLLTRYAKGVICTTQNGLYSYDADGRRLLSKLPEQFQKAQSLNSLAVGRAVFLGTNSGLFQLTGGQLVAVEALKDAVKRLGLTRSNDVRQVAASDDGRVAVALEGGLFLSESNKDWRPVYPRQGNQSWAPFDVRGVAFDRQGRLWFASTQGVGRFDGKNWALYTGKDGLPYNDFTLVAPGENGVVWFGTTQGAIRFDGAVWNYRMAPAWLPENGVRSIAVADKGHAWFATSNGVGQIERRDTTLRQKAKFYEDEIDKYHRRTPYEYVISARLKNVDDKSEWTNRDNDNDGLWTSMYGAGECFAYAATKDPLAKQRAKKAFEAVRFLSSVTQGGTPPALRGFPARSILPTSGDDPNVLYRTVENDRRAHARNPLWKVLVPRWPVSAGGKWYWKADTSSDELDGHYFLNAVYYDLVADTEEEKQRVRDVVVPMTDHLIENNFQLIDHDGKATRWGRFSPVDLNGDVIKGARGLNSLSILAYLKVAEHMTGDPKYRKAYYELVDTHSYATNALDSKRRNGPGTGNQSDDEMAFMAYYTILKYETDPRLRKMYEWSLRWHWIFEEPEKCPLFNFIFAARDDGRKMDALRIPERKAYLAEAVDTLKRIPLDRVRRTFKNSHRIDVVRMPKSRYRYGVAGHLYNGKVVPIDERSVEYWNHDPWRLDENHDDKTLCDGALFLLPYYMGLYHGFIVE